MWGWGEIVGEMVHRASLEALAANRGGPHSTPLICPFSLWPELVPSGQRLVWTISWLPLP